MSDLKIVENELALTGGFEENWEQLRNSQRYILKGIHLFEFSFDDGKTYINLGTYKYIPDEYIHFAVALFYFLEKCNGKDTIISCQMKTGEEFRALFRKRDQFRFNHIVCECSDGKIVRIRAYDDGN
jgi:hypothetical protein